MNYPNNISFDIVKIDKHKFTKLISVIFFLPAIYTGLYFAIISFYNIPILIFSLLTLLLIIFIGIYSHVVEVHHELGKLELTPLGVSIITDGNNRFIPVSKITKFYISYSSFYGQMKLLSLSLWKRGYGNDFRGTVISSRLKPVKIDLNLIVLYIYQNQKRY